MRPSTRLRLVTEFLDLPNAATLFQFWSRVARTDDPDACWLWLGDRMVKNGRKTYGRFFRYENRKRVKKGVPTLAHRVAFILHHGIDDPKGLFVCHTCDNPPCCNPKHLFLEDNEGNMADASQKDRLGRKLSNEGALRLIELAKDENLTQEEIGEMFNISQSYVSQILRGHAKRHLAR